jgi:hypothetical protein
MKKEELDNLVFDYFDLRHEERVIINELASYVGPSLQPGSLSYNSLVKSMRKPPSQDQIDRYRQRLVDVLVDWRNITGGKGELTAVAWTGRSVPIGGVIVTISKSRPRKSPVNRMNDDGVLAELLSVVSSVIDSRSDRLQTLPDVIAIKDNRIAIVKPLIMRFWLERSAIDDAGKLVSEINSIRITKKIP